MVQQVKDDLTNADVFPSGIDGGLNLKADPTRLAPPITTRSDNAHYDGIGNVSQLPGFVSSGLNGARHVYNVHARDCNQPSSTGDVLVHGEYLDGTNGYTVPTWAHNNGNVPSLNQPTLPYNARTKVLANRLGGPNNVLNSQPLEQQSPQFVKQDIVPTGARRRYVLGFGQSASVTTFRYVTGNVDGLTESGFYSQTIGTPAQSPGGTGICDMATLQQTSNFVGLSAQFVTGGTYNLAVTTFDFSGNVLGTVVITGALLTLDDGAPAYQLVQHAGRTYVAYYGNSDKYLRFYDVLSTNTYLTSIGSGTVTGAFTVFSPYPNTLGSGEFLGVIKNNAVYLLYRPSSINGFTLVMGPQTLPVASTLPSGTNRLQATATLLIRDSGGGTGGNASFLITVFRNYPEVYAGNSRLGQVSLNSIAVDQLSYVAPANPATSGTVSNLQTNVFRAPGGVLLASYAFNQTPGEASFVGSSASKHALCLVRAMAFEPSGTSGGVSYGQPTYFLINQRARVAGRYLESLTIGGSSKAANTSANTSTLPTNPAPFLNNLSRPLFLSGDDATSDLAALTIALPAWSITNATFAPPVKVSNTFILYNAQPATANYTPTAIVLQQTSTNASVPAVQGGPYTITSGALTCIHDGAQSSEANYHFACPNLVVDSLTSGTVLGTTSNASYYYVGVLEWYDEQGQLHRSTPSLPSSCYILTNFYGANVYCPVIPSAKPGSVILKVYRSIANRLLDTNYYLVATVATNDGYYYSAVDNTVPDAAAVTDSASVPTSGAINSFPRLYTGVAANNAGKTYASNPPPPFLWQTGSKGRHFGLAQIQGQFQLIFSSSTAAQLAPEWNSFNYSTVPFDIGDARSIESIDEKLVVFGTRYNGVIVGAEIPTANSTGIPTPDDFGKISPIPTPAGVIGTGAPVRVPEGIVYQGYSGVQLLDRSLTNQPVGMPVDLLTGRQTGNVGTIYGRGVTLPSLQSVVWPNAFGAALVYSYLTKKFSLWPLLGNACALVQTTDGNIVTALQPIASGVYAGPASASAAGCDLGTLQASSYAPIYVPSATAPGLVIETPWILPHGTSGGEARVVNGCLTGTWQGPHVLQIEQAYDYEPYSLTRTVDFSTAPRRYQVIAQPRANTRCVAIRYRFTLLPTTSLGSGYLMATLSDFVLFSAQQQGTTRTSANLRS